MIDYKTSDWSDIDGRPLEEQVKPEVLITNWDDDIGKYERTIIEPYLCSDDELGLNGQENSRFYPLNADDLKIVEKAKNFFYCFDHKTV